MPYYRVNKYNSGHTETYQADSREGPERVFFGVFFPVAIVIADNEDEAHGKGLRLINALPSNGPCRNFSLRPI